MKAYQADIAKFEANDTQVFGLSIDSPFANAEFAKQIGVTFPILSDIKHTTLKDYGIYNEEGGYGNRATFVIDPLGVVRHASITDQNVGRSPDETLRVLQALRTGELCPVGWRKGQPTLKAA